ncbi:MAG: protein translocase subunit SecD [Bdellovibrio sp.]|nr:protein translocase subunit SecD [Bdellovibrio sp.]
MSRSWWLKFILLCIFVVSAGVYVYPTIVNLDPETSKFPFKQKINLGLDLQGGLYMVLGVDFNKVYRDVVERQASSLKDRFKEKSISVTQVKMVREGFAADDPRISVDFEADQREAVYQLLKKEFTWNLRLAAETAGHFELGLTHDYRNDVRERTLNQSIEVIRNRIDEFGVSEPSITSQGLDRVVVELPGVKEIDRAKELIGRTAKLEFKIVDDKTMGPGELQNLISDVEKKNGFSFKEGQKFSDYVRKLNEFAKGKIPEEDEIAFGSTKGAGGEEGRVPYLLHSKTQVTGNDLQDASVQLDQENRKPSVAFSLNPRGASLFDKLTAENVGRRLAIVLDNIVHSAPNIRERIPQGRGSISLGRGDQDAMMKEAKDLAIVLRAGALPAQLDFLEQRVVGPSLGQDSIHKGAMASLIGSAVVFVFVAIYYQVSGLIAVFSLLLNVLFVLACLVGLEATLTLPGIAGIALTVGIAVDSNVVIYERIREELRHGKGPGGAVEAGFQKAFRTILDANVTNAAAAVVLLYYGTGAIKGFAVSLLVGIVTTLFTAVFVCRLIFDFYVKYLEDRGARKLSI